MNRDLQQHSARVLGDQNGGSVQTAGGGNVLGSRGIAAAQSADNPNVAAIQQKQTDLGHASELRLNPKTGIYESADTQRQMAANPTLGSGGSLPVTGSDRRVSSAAVASEAGSSSSAGANTVGASTPSQSASGGGTATHMADAKGAGTAAAGARSRPVTLPYGEGRVPSPVRQV